MRYLRSLFLLGQLARLTFLTTPTGTPGPAGGSGSGGGGTGTAGASPEGSQGAPAGAPAGDPAGGPQTGAQGAAGDQAAQNVADLPEWAQKTIRDAREEAAKNRVGRTAAETARADALRGLAAALGVDVTDTPPDPAALQGQVQSLTGERDAARGETQALTVQLAAWRHAAGNGADPVALTDSATFLAAARQLDPTAADFTAKLGAAIKAAVAANPALALRQGQAPARGGFDPSGGTGGQPAATSLEDAYARKFAPTP